MSDAARAFLHRVLTTPEREAVYDRATGRRYSYGEMGARGARLAAYLTGELGLRQGDVVALAAESCVAFPDAFYASLISGVVITTYNVRLRIADTAPLIARERPRAMLVAEAYREKMGEAAREAGVACDFVSIDGGADCPVARYDDIMAGHSRKVSAVDFARAGEIDAECTQMLVHTGGTTGLPKSAKISFRAVLYNAASAALSIGITQDCVGLVFLPFFHTVGWNVAMLPHLLTGGRVVLTDTLDPGVLLRLIETERPTSGLVVEAILLCMAKHPDFAKTDFSSYKFIANGAGPISESTMRLYWERGVKVVNAYGMTETGPNNCLCPDCDAPLDDIRRHAGTIGKPMYFNELKIVDEQGREVPDGVDGELLWRGPVMFSGYWDDDEATRAAMAEGGWVRSGDIGHRDAEGYVHLKGRRKHMIITNGENVFPIEVENVLKGYPGVADCFVIAVPDAKRGEVGKALVLMAEGVPFDREGLATFAKERLSTIKVPRYFAQVDELPKSGLKVNVARLQEAYGFAGE